jgi:hypothetical protein
VKQFGPDWRWLYWTHDTINKLQQGTTLGELLERARQESTDHTETHVKVISEFPEIQHWPRPIEGRINTQNVRSQPQKTPEGDQSSQRTTLGELLEREIQESSDDTENQIKALPELPSGRYWPRFIEGRIKTQDVRSQPEMTLDGDQSPQRPALRELPERDRQGSTDHSEHQLKAGFGLYHGQYWKKPITGRIVHDSNSDKKLILMCKI